MEMGYATIPKITANKMPYNRMLVLVFFITIFLIGNILRFFTYTNQFFWFSYNFSATSIRRSFGWLVGVKFYPATNSQSSIATARHFNPIRQTITANQVINKTADISRLVLILDNAPVTKIV
jgi:hypothetical protein